jgi:hypothetical protein
MSNVSVVIVINSPASVTITFTPSGTFTAPVAVGTVIGTFAITPSGWSGAVALSGANASDFSVVDNAGVVELTAAVALAAGLYDVTATATP